MPLTCAICHASLAPHAHYIVRIDLFADPTLPPMTTEALEQVDPAQSLPKLLEQMAHLSADDLQDQVHRRFEYHLCPACHRQFLDNPLGLPRRRTHGTN